MLLKHCHLPLLLLLIAACGCGRRGSGAGDFAETLYTPQYAECYTIASAPEGESVMISTLTPWQGADSTATTRLLILRNGEEAPEGYDGQVLRGGEARRIVCMSSTHVSMLDRLGEVGRVVGVSLPQYYTNPHIAAAGIPDVGYESSIDYETLVALRPDLVTLYGLAGANPMEPRLRELGIPYIYIGEYLEQSPLGKAEWLVPMAELVGRRADGERLFARIPQRYDSLKALAAAAPERPRVMVNSPYGDSWVMSPTESYVGRLIADAGGRYVYTANASGRSLPIDMEEAYRLTNSADVWLNVGPITSLGEIAQRYPRLAATPPVRNGRVWDSTLQLTPSGGNSYWEWGVLEPDNVLADLIKIFHPDLLADTPFTFYRQLEP